MLKSIDILIGLSVVMLVLSLVITVLTQAITNLFQLRGKSLRDGIAGLLQQIQKTLPPGVSQAIAEAILTHPLIRAAGSSFGTVIHREELTALLLELASGDGPQQLEASVRDHLCTLLKDNGIDNPAEVLDRVRSRALLLEHDHPELANNERYAMAFLKEAPTKFLSKLHGWFDQTIDRVADRFTNSARIVTFVGSLALALVLQVDTGVLVNRLSVDPALRQALVAQAVTLNNQAATSKSPTPEQLQKHLQELAIFDVLDVPTSLSDWIGRWTGDRWPTKMLGIVFTAMLLSLGAPFWYNALKNLIRLRSMIAQKDDDQRLIRQTNTSEADTDITLSASSTAPGTVGGTSD
jgi:hypothetical protein